MRGSKGWSTLLVLALVVGIGGACGKRKGLGPGDGLGESAGLGESGLGSGSSLERARRGLAPEEDGILRDVRFAYDSYDLDSMGHEAVAGNAEWLRQNPRAKVELEGHADSRGTIEYNLALGAKRARAVKDQLVSQGIAPDRISTISYGEELPLCREESESCWARNRRAHAVVLGQ